MRFRVSVTKPLKVPDLTITINWSALEKVKADKVTIDEQIANGTAKLAGDRKPLDQLKSILVQFTPDFEMMPGTKPVKSGEPIKNPFEQEEPGNSAVG